MKAVDRRHWPRARRGALIPLLLVALAEGAARAAGLESDSLAAPSAVALAFGQILLDGTLLLATYETLTSMLAGLALGGAIGLLAGLLLGFFPVAHRLLDVSIEVLRPIPSVALIPIFMLSLGFGFAMEIVIVAFAALWPVLILTTAAVAGVEPRLLEVGRSLGFGLPARLWKIVLPAILPRIFVAVRLAAGIALIVAVTVEIAANPLGLGHAMMAAQQSLRPATMLAHLVWIGVLGWGLNALLVRTQSRLFGPSMAAAAAAP